MGWQDALKVCAAVIASLGGGGAIVFGLSGFLGKIWAERALQDDRQRYTQLNLQLEGELCNASQRLQVELDRFGLVNKLRIEGEFQRLATLWKHFANLSFAFNSVSSAGFKIVPAEEQARVEYTARRRHEFETALHDAQQVFYEEMVFIPKPIADLAQTTLKHALQENNLYLMFFEHHDPQIKAKYHEYSPQELQRFMDGMTSLEDAIREHIRDASKGM